MKNKHCKNEKCGIEINRENARFCYQCGASTRKERKGLFTLIVTLALPVGALVGIYNLAGPSNDTPKKPLYQERTINIQPEKNQMVEIFSHPITGQPLRYEDVYQPFVTRAQNAMSLRDFGSERGWESYLYQEHRKDYFGPGLDLPRHGQFMNVREFENLRGEFIKSCSK